MGFYDELVALVQRTRNDPQLFHRLVYEPETVLDEIGFLSQDAKRQILGLSPAELTAKLLGCEAHSAAVQAQGDCGVTCDEPPSACGGVCSMGNSDILCQNCTGCSDCTTGASACLGCTACSWGGDSAGRVPEVGEIATPDSEIYRAFRL
jgi:hypothetical protein